MEPALLEGLLSCRTFQRVWHKRTPENQAIVSGFSIVIVRLCLGSRSYGRSMMLFPVFAVIPFQVVGVVPENIFATVAQFVHRLFQEGKGLDGILFIKPQKQNT